MKLFCSRQFVAFLLTGGVAGIVNFGSRILYSRVVDFSSAILLAFLTGLVTAFVLARTFVFVDSRQSLGRSGMLFVLVNLVALLQTWTISLGLAHYLFPSLGVSRFAEEMAHAVGIAVPVVTSYLGHKYWSFR